MKLYHGSDTEVNQPLAKVGRHHLDFGEGFLRYDGNVEPHSHFQCEKCGAVIDIMETAEGCEKMLPKGCTLSSASLYLYGKCMNCK